MSGRPMNRWEWYGLFTAAIVIFALLVSMLPQPQPPPPMPPMHLVTVTIDNKTVVLPVLGTNVSITVDK